MKTKEECRVCFSPINEQGATSTICADCQDKLDREDKLNSTWQHDPIFYSERYEY